MLDIVMDPSVRSLVIEVSRSPFPFRPEIDLGSVRYEVMRRLLFSLEDPVPNGEAPDSERASRPVPRGPGLSGGSH
jgi:hypothetical protein